MKFENFSLIIKTIQLNSGSVLVDSTRIFIKWSIKILRPSILHLSSLVKCHGISAGKSNMII